MIDFIVLVTPLYLLIGGLSAFATMQMDKDLSFNAVFGMVLFWPLVLTLAFAFAVVAAIVGKR